MKFIVLFVLLPGCIKVIPVATREFTPTLAAAVGITAKGAVVVPDVPSDECETCGGQGWLGDATIKKDCPDCDIAWDATPSATVEGDGALALPVVGGPLNAKGGDPSLLDCCSAEFKEMALDFIKDEYNRAAEAAKEMQTELPEMQPPVVEKIKLTVRLSDVGCPPCAQFKRDRANNKDGLAEYLDEWFEVEEVQAVGRELRPAFIVDGVTELGYQSSGQLLKWLNRQREKELVQ